MFSSSSVIFDLVLARDRGAPVPPLNGRRGLPGQLHQGFLGAAYPVAGAWVYLTGSPALEGGLYLLSLVAVLCSAVGVEEIQDSMAA